MVISDGAYLKSGAIIHINQNDAESDEDDEVVSRLFKKFV